MTYLVDTDYVADYLKGRSHVLPLFKRLVPEGIGISIITFAEVYEGIYYGQRRSHYEKSWRVFLQMTPVFGISRSIAKCYASIRGNLARKGQLIDQPDLFIAATAIKHDLTLVTRNHRDFERIPTLKLYQKS
jgi:tRNA(fMet)-specific endonuclease VapC